MTKPTTTQHTKTMINVRRIVGLAPCVVPNSLLQIKIASCELKLANGFGNQGLAACELWPGKKYISAKISMHQGTRCTLGTRSTPFF